MRICILYFEGCPNHQPVVDLAQRVILDHGLNATVEEVEVAPDDVVRLRFLGSPTVQVDGIDIEPAARERTDFAMSCRVYDAPDGLPSKQMLLDALGIDSAGTQASWASSNGTGMFALGGSVATAALASACCWLPLLLLTIGLSAGGVAGVFEPLRPFMLIAAALFLGSGFYFAYFRGFRRAACTSCEACAAPKPRLQRFNRAMLWVAAAFVAAFALFPYYSPAVIRAIASPSAAESIESASHSHDAEPNTTRTFRVEGMTCVACATTLEMRLARLPGVSQAVVSYQDATATIRSGPEEPTDQVVKAAIERAGFQLTDGAPDH